MKCKLAFVVAFSLAAAQPNIASASTFVLDTGTPSSPPAFFVLNGAGWYAAEFYATAGETITDLSVYLTQGAGAVGNTFTWALYSPNGTFLGRSNTREAPSLTTTGTYTSDGWNSVAVDYSVTTSGYYWLALEPSSAQTPGLDLPEEAPTDSGTVPAIAFAYSAGSSGLGFSTQNVPFGIEVTAVSAVPLPGALPLFATGLGALGLLGWRRKKKAALLAA